MATPPLSNTHNPGDIVVAADVDDIATSINTLWPISVTGPVITAPAPSGSDDTIMLQALLSANPGKVIQMQACSPSNPYLFSTTLVCPQFTHLRGATSSPFTIANPGTFFKKVSGNNTDLMSLGATWAHGTIIEGIGFFAGAGQTTGSAITMIGGEIGSVRDCTFRDFPTSALHLISGAAPATFYNLSIYNNHWGIFFDNCGGTYNFYGLSGDDNDEFFHYDNSPGNVFGVGGTPTDNPNAGGFTFQCNVYGGKFETGNARAGLACINSHNPLVGINHGNEAMFHFIGGIAQNRGVYKTGTTASATPMVATFAGTPFTAYNPNGLVGFALYYTSGAAAFTGKIITANTANTITTGAFSPVPTAGGGDTFEVQFITKSIVHINKVNSSTRSAQVVIEGMKTDIYGFAVVDDVLATSVPVFGDALDGAEPALYGSSGFTDFEQVWYEHRIAHNIRSSTADYTGAFAQAGRWLTVSGNKPAIRMLDTSGGINTYSLWCSGTGDPNAVVTALPGSLYTRMDPAGSSGHNLWVKASGTGNTGWIQGTPRLLSLQTVGTSSTAINHGLGYQPQNVIPVPTSAGTVWRSAGSSSTQVFLQASVTMTSSVDIYVW